MPLPNFLLVGAAKAGTTSLSAHLAKHPDVFMPSPSEPKFLTSGVLSFPHRGPGDDRIDAGVVRDLKAYRALFDNATGVTAIGEKSADLLFYHQEVIPVIHEVLGDPLILAILRNPADRTFSAYNFFVGQKRETLSFEEALEAEPSRLAANWEFVWGYRAASLYADAIEAYQAAFSRVHVVLFDDLKRDPQGVLREVLTLLGVNPEAGLVETDKIYNASKAPRSQRVAAWRGGQGTVGSVLEMGRGLVPRWARAQIRKGVDAWSGKAPRLTRRQRAQLAASFEHDIRRLESLIDRDLSVWRPEGAGSSATM